MIQVVNQTHKQKVKMYMKVKKKKLAEMLANRDKYEDIQNLSDPLSIPESASEYYWSAPKDSNYSLTITQFEGETS